MVLLLHDFCTFNTFSFVGMSLIQWQVVVDECEILCYELFPYCQVGYFICDILQYPLPLRLTKWTCLEKAYWLISWMHRHLFPLSQLPQTMLCHLKLISLLMQHLYQPRLRKKLLKDLPLWHLKLIFLLMLHLCQPHLKQKQLQILILRSDFQPSVLFIVISYFDNCQYLFIFVRD